MDNFEKCYKKENLEKHKQILNSLYDATIIDLTDECKKTNDLKMVYKNGEYIVECKSDRYCNDALVVELVANFRDKKFKAGFYNVGDDKRKELEQYIDELLQDERYRSTAYFSFSEKRYMLSYIAGAGDNKSYYLLKLNPLCRWIKENWKNKLLLVNTDDSCSIMIKIFRDEFLPFLIAEKQSRIYEVL